MVYNYEYIIINLSVNKIVLGLKMYNLVTSIGRNGLHLLYVYNT